MTTTDGARPILVGAVTDEVGRWRFSDPPTMRELLDAHMDACDRLKAAESRIRELEGEITYLVKVGRCGGGVSGTSFDADGGFSYSNECSLPIGHTGFHADLQNEHPAEWSDWRIRLERPAIGVYEVQEEGNGVAS